MIVQKVLLAVSLLMLSSFALETTIKTRARRAQVNTHRSRSCEPGTTVRGASQTGRNRARSCEGNINLGNPVCIIDLKDDLSGLPPVFLKPRFAHGNDAFYLPVQEHGKTVLKVPEGHDVRMACPGNYLKINNKRASNNFVSATCKSGKFSIQINTISCDGYSSQRARDAEMSNCPKNYKGYDLGFEVDRVFYKQMDICFDQTKENTLYSAFHLTKAIFGKIPINRGRGFEQKHAERTKTIYTPNDLTKVYNQDNQRTEINRLVGIEDDSDKYTYVVGKTLTEFNSKQSPNLYLNKGHLTPKAAFVYGCQDKSTFHFINVAPQWETFNNGNWDKLEKDVRDYAIDTKQDLIIYTGTYGVMTLPHKKTGKAVEIYLYNEGGVKKIPVPAQYWKIVYNEATKAGVAFLGVHNPYIANSDVKKFRICTDICNQLDWLGTRLVNNRENNDLGYVYCCRVDEFKTNSGIRLPDFEVNKLLKKKNRNMIIPTSLGISPILTKSEAD